MFLGLDKNIKINMRKYKNEFEDFRTNTNIQRCEKLGIALLILNMILIAIDLVVFKDMRAETPSYLYLFYLHIIAFILIIAWFTFLKLNRKFNNVIDEKLLYHILINIALYWCVFIGLNDLYINGQITVFIICILAISACVYVTPVEAFITYAISITIFIIGLVFVIKDEQILYAHIVNSGVVTFIAYIASNLSFKGFARDFINKKNILESKMELEVTNQKLKEYEKLRTAFFANISHELRTPINVIYSAQQMMEFTLNQNELKEDEINKYLIMAKQNSHRLIRLIENLIDITKIDSENFQVDFVNLDIIKLVEDITIAVARFVEDKGLTFTFDTCVEEKIISCDPKLIERIVLNLLSNSVKFTEDGRDILVYIYLEDNKVCISVKDNGIGIPDEMKELIFDRFIQVDKSISKRREGSGIGLALVKSLVEMHRGSITLNSNLGEGSEFIIKLPDSMLVENKKIENISNLEADYLERINIEFSDIYD